MSAAPVVGAAVVLLLVPGALVAWVAGVRGVLVAGVAPLLSASVAGGAAVVAATIGIRWGAAPFAVATAAAALVALVLRFGVRARPPAGDEDVPPPVRDGRSPWGWALAGVLVGATALASGVTRGLGSPDRWPQTYDAVFHLDAAWRVLDTGDGSSLTLGTLDHPELARAFYPAAWHDLVALVAGTTGADVVVATSALSVATVAVAWPLGCVAVARVAFGADSPVLAATGVLSAGVAASPVLLVSYGTLWPNALGTAVLPAALALTVAIASGAHGTGERSAAVVSLLLGVPGLALVHPNAVVALLVLGVVAVGVLTWGRGVRARLATGGAAVVLVWLVGWSPVFEATRGTSWGARQSTGQALGEWLTLSPERTPVPLLVVALAALGSVAAWRRPRLRWLLAVHATAGVLWVLVSGSDGRLSRLVSGPWWDDPFRLGALVGVAGVPLAALGVRALSGRCARLLPRLRERWAGAVAVVLLLTVVVGSGGLYRDETSRVVTRWAASQAMLGPQERGLLEQLDRWVPDDERVAGNPWDGMGFTGPLADREAVFPHLTGRWGSDRDLLAESLRDAATRPDVCAALDRLRVTHVLVGRSRFWLDDRRRALYAGLEVSGRPGFEEVARAGTASLWRVTACASPGPTP